MMPSSNVCPYGEAPNGAREARALPQSNLDSRLRVPPASE